MIHAPAQVVAELVAARRELTPPGRAGGRRALPSRLAITGVMEGLRAALFPDHSSHRALSDLAAGELVAERLESSLNELHEQLRCALWYGCQHAAASDRRCDICDQHASEVSRAFAERLPALRLMLGHDLRAAYDGDPAAASLDEALLCYPGITAIIHHRIAHELHHSGVPLLPRMIAALAHAQTGVDIHPGARIGQSFFIDHGTGVVIGETCVIGDRVRLYQGVTLGAKSFEVDETGRLRKGVRRHPTVEDDVIIYANATVLGKITVGKGSVIGGNVWVTRSVPPGSRLNQVAPRQELFSEGAGI